MEETNYIKGDDNNVDKAAKDIFGEDGKIQPWVFNNFFSFLAKHKPSAYESLCGNEANSAMETEMAHKGSPCSEMEREHNEAAPTSPEKQKGGIQKHVHEEDGGIDANSEPKMDMVHQATPNSEMDTDKLNIELKEEEDLRKELLLKLMHLAAKKGNIILKEASFLNLFSEVMMLESIDNHVERMDRAKALGKHVLFSANDFIQSKEGKDEAPQCEDCSNEGGKLADITQKIFSKGQTATQGPADKVPCIMDGQESIIRWTKGSSKKSTVDDSHIPQNVEKVVQIFQNTLEATEATQHVNQGIQNGGKSSLPFSLGQTYLMDKAKELHHVTMEEKNKPLSEMLQQSSKKQKYGKTVTDATVDEDGKETCATHIEQAMSSFADVLKNGHKSKSYPPSSTLTDEKENIALSFSQALQQSQVFSHSFHATDDSSLFKVEPEVLERRLNICKFSVVGKLSLGKGEKAWNQKNLKDKLQGVWGLKSSWKLIGLGKGYFHIILNSQDEWNKVWSRGPLHLKPGVMRFQRWSLDFDPWTEKSSFAQVWLRIYHLPWALWDPSIIAGIARKVGEPLKFDKVTVEGEFGHYARILVDVDLSKPLKPSVHIECGKFTFEVKLVPENLPAFCRGCTSIGHDTKDCWNFFKKKDFAANSKSIGGEERVLNSTVSVGTLERFSAGSDHASKNPTMNKNTQVQMSEWRRKKANGNENEQKEKVLINDVVESITDFSAQTGSHCSYDVPSSYVAVSNQFAALQTNDDFENQKKDDYKNKRHVDDNVIPKRWSDILDEEDEKEDAPFLDKELPVKATITHPDRDKKLSQEKTKGRDISEIRKGLQEMSQDYAHLLHTPISNKKKKKHKQGIQQTEEQIGTS